MIIADNLSVNFPSGFGKKRITALDHFNISIKPGEFFALVGPNGAGKSTAMYCLLGLLQPDSGKVTIFGKIPELGSDLYDKIGYLPEEPNYHNYLTVEELINNYSDFFNKKIPPDRINSLLEKFGLVEFRKLKMSKCSKGMKQKAGIIQAIINEPEILFLDEPTRGLDPIAVKEFRDMLKEIHSRGTTIIMNTHVLSEVESLATNVAIMDKGKLLVQDSLTNITRPQEDFYAVEFESSINYPEYLVKEISSQGTLKGLIPSSRLNEFMSFIKENNLKLFTCSVKKTSLEDTLFKIIKEENKNA